MTTNMRDVIYLGSSPAEESCAQVGAPDYFWMAKKECEIYIKAIRRKCGKEPAGVTLMVKENAHDFGENYEVVCAYMASNPKAVRYAYRVEARAPGQWSTAEREELAAYKQRLSKGAL